jgi:transposase InsO family protein
MTVQPLFQFGTVTLHPTPDGCVIGRQATLGEQLFDVARESEQRRYQRTAQRISSGAECRHLKIVVRVACFTIVLTHQPTRPSCNTSRKAAVNREARYRATRVNEAWSVDFVHDQLSKGQSFRALTVIDVYSREALAIQVGQRLRGEHVVAVLN